MLIKSGDNNPFFPHLQRDAGISTYFQNHLINPDRAAGSRGLVAPQQETVNVSRKNWNVHFDLQLPCIPTKLSLGKGAHQLTMRKVIEKSTRVWQLIAHALTPSIHKVKGPTP